MLQLQDGAPLGYDIGIDEAPQRTVSLRALRRSRPSDGSYLVAGFASTTVAASK